MTHCQKPAQPVVLGMSKCMPSVNVNMLIACTVIILTDLRYWWYVLQVNDAIMQLTDAKRSLGNWTQVLEEASYCIQVLVFLCPKRHNNGHVTVSQFRQSLTILELHCTEAEMQALEAKFCNDTGFSYRPFLEELQPQDPPKLMYMERLAELRLTNLKSKLPEGSGVARHLEEILNKIRAKVTTVTVSAGGNLVTRVGSTG